MLAYRLHGDYIEATNELIYLEYLILILYLGLEVLSFFKHSPSASPILDKRALKYPSSGQTHRPLTSTGSRTASL